MGQGWKKDVYSFIPLDFFFKTMCIYHLSKLLKQILGLACVRHDGLLLR